MKVRLTTGRASEDEVWEPGDEIDLEPEEAKRLLESGQAEPVTQKRADKRETRTNP